MAAAVSAPWFTPPAPAPPPAAPGTTTTTTGTTVADIVGLQRPAPDSLQVGAVNPRRVVSLCEHGRLDDAVAALTLLVRQGQGRRARRVHNGVFHQLLRRCCGAGTGPVGLARGRQVHALSVAGGHAGCRFLGTHLIGMYAAHGALRDARAAFDAVRAPDAHNWAAVIMACARLGAPADGVALYARMVGGGGGVDGRVAVAALAACAGAGDLARGRAVHEEVVRVGQADAHVVTAAVDMYARCGDLDAARRAAEGVAVPAAWTALLAGYARAGRWEDAVAAFWKAREAGGGRVSAAACACVLGACAGAGVAGLADGRRVHAWVEDAVAGDPSVRAGLVNMYGRCGSLADARAVFDRFFLLDSDGAGAGGTPNSLAAACNAMVGAYARAGMGDEALRLYDRLGGAGLTPDRVTYACLAQACGALGARGLPLARRLHARLAPLLDHHAAAADDVVLASCVVDMLARCGDLRAAQAAMDAHLPPAARDAAAWTTMMAAYTRAGRPRAALALYASCCAASTATSPPPAAATACALHACAAAGALTLGAQIHAASSDPTHPRVAAAAVHMYAKCGAMGAAESAFASAPAPALGAAAWGALAAGYARHGDARAAVGVLRAWEAGSAAGTAPPPDAGAVAAAVTACGHAGQASEARAVAAEWAATAPSAAVDGDGARTVRCVVDGLARAGRLREAVQAAEQATSEDQAVVVWTSVLSACVTWGDVDVARVAFDRAVAADGAQSAPYVLMANVYAGAGMFEAAREVDARRRRAGAWKGRRGRGETWWVGDGGAVRSFGVGGGGVGCGGSGEEMDNAEMLW